MTKPRYNLAIRSARTLLEDQGIVEPPIDVERIARTLGFAVRRGELNGDVSGTAIRRGMDIVLGINSKQSPERQRFSLAHELGHALLHDDPLHLDELAVIGFRSDLSSTANDPKEVEANQFAAELLMPEAFIRKDLEGEHDAELDAVIESLAKRYQVSIQAMAIRVSKFANFIL